MIAVFLATLLIGGSAELTKGNRDPSEAPSICAGSQSEGTLVAHENCHKFYECAGGVPVPFECPEDLNFDPTKNQCDWPGNVDCSGREISNLSEDLNDIQVFSDKASLFEVRHIFPFVIPNGNSDSSQTVEIAKRDLLRYSKSNSDPGQAAAICAASLSEGTLVAHESCHKFYECAKGRPIAIDCPPNLLYNPDKEYCDWPENVDCSDREVFGEPNKFFIKDPQILKKINTNVNQVMVKQSLEDNEHLVLEENSNTQNSYFAPIRNNSDPSQAASICAQPNSDSVLVAHEDCNKFYKCFKGSPVPIDCPWGLLYNTDKEICDWAENVDCEGRNH